MNVALDDLSGLAPMIEVGGERLELRVSGAVYWPDMQALIVADLHFEKGSSFAARGQFIPPYDTGTTLAALTAEIARTKPSMVIALGDSFHDPDAAGRLPDPYRQILSAMQVGRDWVWVAGNHDPEPANGLDGDFCDQLAVGSLVFRHEPLPRPVTGELAGHLHPAARLRRRGRSVRRRCFATNGDRMVLPAYGAYTGGLNVLDAAWAPVFGAEDFLAWMIGRQRLYAVAASQLRGD